MEIRLNDLKVGMCEACDSGWGTCLLDHACQVEDDFAIWEAAQAMVREAPR